MKRRSTHVGISPCKKSRNNGIGHISNLPETVMSHIMSRLPIDDAARTSILSKDWRFKWTSVYNVDIQDRKCPKIPGSEEATFVNFIDRILRFSLNLKTFRLKCWNKYDSSRMTTLILAALRRNVESFEFGSLSTIGVILPCSLLNSTSLRNLKLEWGCTLKLDADNCFPNLTTLNLSYVKILNGNLNNDTLRLTFPALETFKLKYCRWLNVKLVEVYALVLIEFSSYSNGLGVYDYTIKILGPRLAKFESRGLISEKFILNGSRVVSAILHNVYYNADDNYDLHLLKNVGLQLRNLLHGLPVLEELVLSDLLAEAWQVGPPLPGYNHLRRLELGYSLINHKQLFGVLHATPTLKFLSINVYDLDDYDYDTMECVPSCIVSHLEDIELRGFVGKPLQYNLAKFLLKKGEKLMKLYLFGIRRRKDMQNILEQISLFPKYQTGSEIAFIEGPCSMKACAARFSRCLCSCQPSKEK